MFFHPQDSREIVTDRRQIENFALRFTHFLKIEAEGKGGKYKVDFDKSHKGCTRLPETSQTLLKELQKRQQARIASLSQQYSLSTVNAVIDWRLVVGLGADHVQETNMTLHHIYGIPYIPGSAVKGVIRNYFVSEKLQPDCPQEENLSILDAILAYPDIKGLRKDKNFEKLGKWCRKYGEPKEKALEKAATTWELLDRGQTIFGTQAQCGSVVFLDAFPTGNVNFTIDIMNPHYPKYYNKKGNEQVPPNDCQDPTPINFLTVENTAFNFYLMEEKRGNQNNDHSLLDIVTSWLQEALQFHGIGAKTAVGYGYFENFGDQTEAFEQEVEQQRQQEAQETARAYWESLSPVERLCEELKTLKDENRSYEIYNNELDKFDGEDQKKLAAALKAYWQSIDRWSGKSVSKKQKKKISRLKAILGE